MVDVSCGAGYASGISTRYHRLYLLFLGQRQLQLHLGFQLPLDLNFGRRISACCPSIARMKQLRRGRLQEFMEKLCHLFKGVTAAALSRAAAASASQLLQG